MNKSNHKMNDVSFRGNKDSKSETNKYDEKSHQNGVILQTFLDDKNYKGLKVQKKVDLPQIQDTFRNSEQKNEIPEQNRNETHGTEKYDRKRLLISQILEAKLKDESFSVIENQNSLGTISNAVQDYASLKKKKRKRRKSGRNNDRKSLLISQILKTKLEDKNFSKIKNVISLSSNPTVVQDCPAFTEKEKSREVGIEIPEQKKNDNCDGKSSMTSQILEAELKDKHFSVIKNQNSLNADSNAVQDCAASLKKKNKTREKCEKISVEIHKKKKELLDREIYNRKRALISQILKAKLSDKTFSEIKNLISLSATHNAVPDCPASMEKERSKKVGNMSIEIPKQKENKTFAREKYNRKNLLISQILEAKLKDKSFSEILTQNSINADPNAVQVCPATMEIKNKVEECDNNSNEKKKEVLSENQNLSEKSKKKKDSLNSSTMSIGNSLHADPNATQNSSTALEKNKRKNKECEHISIEIKKETLLENQNSSDKHKKKRDHSNSYSTSNENVLHADSNIVQNYPTPSEKKKKKKECDNISIEIKKEMPLEKQNSSDKHKKKRDCSNSYSTSNENVLHADSNIVQISPAPSEKKKRECDNISIEIKKETPLENQNSSDKPKKKRDHSNSYSTSNKNVLHADPNIVQNSPAPSEKNKNRKQKECDNISIEIKKETLLENQNSSDKPKKKRDHSNSYSKSNENVLHADPNIVQNSPAHSEKKKNRKKRECENISNEIKKEMLLENQNSSDKPKKKRNRSNSYSTSNENVLHADPNIVQNSPVPSEKKKKEYENISTEIKTEMLLENQNSSDKSKKKRDRSKSHSMSNENVLHIDPNIVQNSPAPSEKKNRKRNKCENISTEIKTEMLFLENQNSSDKPKKKRDRSNSYSTSNENVLHADPNIVQNSPAPSEKNNRKRNKCENISTEIKKEMLVENQNSSDKPKKKRDRSNSYSTSNENVLHADPNIVQNSPAPSEKKKKRKTNTSIEIKEKHSETKIVEFSPNEKKRSRDSKSECNAEQDSPASLKKKKKKREECENISTEIKEISSESQSPDKKKKRKKIKDPDPVCIAPEVIKQDFDTSPVPSAKTGKVLILSNTLIKAGIPGFKFGANMTEKMREEISSKQRA